jgi:hypothetical protein
LEAPSRAHVVMDSGDENLNAAVDEFFYTTALRCVIGQFDVTFSNSLIEAWWRALERQGYACKRSVTSQLLGSSSDST